MPFGDGCIGLSVGSAVLDKLAGVLDELIEADPAVFADGESMVELNRQLERLTAATTRATGAFDASTAWQADGAQSAAAWLRAQCRMPATTAARRVRLGRALRHLPVAEAAWLAGDIGESHVGLFERTRTPGTAEALARDEAMLVDQAKQLRFAAFQQALAYWALRADPDGAEERSRRHDDSRRF